MTNVLTTSGKGCLVFVKKLAKWFVGFIRNVTFRQHTPPNFLNITGWYQEVTVRSFWEHLCMMFPVPALILNWLDLWYFNIVGLRVFRSDECDDVFLGKYHPWCGAEVCDEEWYPWLLLLRPFFFLLLGEVGVFIGSMLFILTCPSMSGKSGECCHWFWSSFGNMSYTMGL